METARQNAPHERLFDTGEAVPLPRSSSARRTSLRAEARRRRRHDQGRRRVLERRRRRRRRHLLRAAVAVAAARRAHRARSSKNAVTHASGAFQLIAISLTDHASMLSTKQASGAQPASPAACA